MAPRILIAAGGTGGHLFPALHIARAIQSAAPDAVVEFIGAGRPLEEQVIDRAGFRRRVISTAGVKRRGMRGWVEFAMTLPRAIAQLRCLFREFSPDAVVGVGGYVTVLPVGVAALRRIPTWIHEAELKPGLANRVLAPLVQRISIAFEDAAMPCRRKVLYTGHPVRAGLERVRRTAPRPVRHLLVLGGSQGAQALDAALIAVAPELRNRGFVVRHQCRRENVVTVAAGYRAAGIEAEVVPFIDDMVGAYEWADLIIGRAGASAVMELEVVNIPAILVPYPFAQGDHQSANAAVLAARGKATIVKEGEGFPERLQAAIVALAEPARYHEMLVRSETGRSADAAARIAAGIIELIESGRAAGLRQQTPSSMLHGGR